jgi:GntR family transcriptional regulator/MocR family aminotransferase
VDHEGLMVDHLPDDAGVICVTPSHQFPLGMAMSPRRRAALLEFAQRRHAVIIEDDYDGEFRFGGRPLDALKTLDRNGQVFYVGTFSKSLFPALRLGFVVTPAWARRALVTAKQLTDWHSPVLAQDTLAAFITEGHLARHVRKMRKLYGERRECLQGALARHCGDRLSPIPGEAGLHLAASLIPSIPATALAARANEAGLGVRPLLRFAMGDTALNGLAIGYGAIPQERIDDAVRLLAKVIGSSAKSGR